MEAPLKNKRLFLIPLVVLLLIVALHFRSSGAAAQPYVVRLALVNVPEDVLRPLLPEFQAKTGMRAEIVYTGNDPFTEAREGKADLVISHYGHEGVQPFVEAGLGLWPHPVFANQVALLGPSRDPAHVRGLTDAAEAIRRIAGSACPFQVNNAAGIKYIEDILWMSAGSPDKDKWYIRSDLSGPAAVRAAAEKGAYVIWGLPPFLRLKRQTPMDLEPLVVADSLFQRIMVSTIVNANKVPGVHIEGAKALQDFLLEPSTQARIRAFRYPDFDQQAWWPAGRHNNARE